MKYQEIIHLVSLFSDIYDANMHIVIMCAKCGKINNIVKISKRISRGKVDFKCKHCKFIDQIYINILGQKIAFMTQRQLDARLKIFKGTDFEKYMDILVNKLLHGYGKIKTKLRRSDSRTKLKIHIKEGLALPVKLIQEITGLSKKEIIELMKK